MNDSNIVYVKRSSNDKVIDMRVDDLGLSEAQLKLIVFMTPAMCQEVYNGYTFIPNRSAGESVDSVILKHKQFVQDREGVNQNQPCSIDDRECLHCGS